ncbi:MAG TPA: zinc ribbon domain-containing protein [Pyrinomonadaceae bacterium]|nr:zinc ribbon domain-containing protein [Pyrinomonadaceae bacterium]
MTPEILHRCESCGATIREAAMFCPECGQPLAVTKPEEPDVNDQASAAPPADAAASTSEQSLPSSSVENHAADADKTVTVDSAKADREPAKAATAERPGARERTRETLHRASTAARGAIERPVKQVEKIHHVSTVMLEEAHYDPSLRFVLVALGLFILFVILLVLSKVMG